MSKIKVNDKNVHELVNDVASFMYRVAEEMPVEEKWHIASKIRNAAMDVLFYVSLAVGDPESKSTSYEWLTAKKNMSALRTLYIFSGKQGFIKLDPEIIVKIDDLSERVEKELLRAQKNEKVAHEEDMKPWLKKYEFWKEMQK